MGLTVTLNSRVEEQFCTSFQSSGFKGLLHVPISQPEMVEYGFALSPGTENFLDLNPKTIRAGGFLPDFPALFFHIYHGTQYIE